MGCASSKDADAGSDKAKDYRSEDTAKPEDVKVQSEPSVKMNAAGRRVSKTVRRVAVRCAMSSRRVIILRALHRLERARESLAKGCVRGLGGAV